MSPRPATGQSSERPTITRSPLPSAPTREASPPLLPVLSLPLLMMMPLVSGPVRSGSGQQGHENKARSMNRINQEHGRTKNDSNSREKIATAVTAEKLSTTKNKNKSSNKHTKYHQKPHYCKLL